jgi:hypothetical protein
MWYFFHRLKEYSDTQKILNAPRVLDGDRHHIKQLEHELGILPCSDAECESCTGVSKRVRYDPALDSYHLTTRASGQFITTTIAREIFDDHYYRLGIK